MSVVLPIETDDRYRIITATLGQTVLAIPFPWQDDNDVRVCIQSDDGDWLTLSNPTNYVLSGAGQPGGGSATLTLAASEGDKFLVQGIAILERTTSIVRSGRFSSSSMDGELDRNRIIQQEQARDFRRSLKSEIGQEGLTVAGNLVDGDTFMKQGARIVKGPNATEISSAQANAEAAVGAWQAIQDLTNDGLAVKLETRTIDAQLDYNLVHAVPGNNGHRLVDLYLQGVLQPKDGSAYTIINDGATVRLSVNPGDDQLLYVEGAAVYGNPLPFDETALVELVRDLQPWADFRRWQIYPTADQRAFFNQCLYDVHMNSGGRGGRIILPPQSIPLSYVDPFTYPGIAIEGSVRPYWEGAPHGTTLVPLGGIHDLFTIGSLSADMEAFSIKNVRVDAAAMGAGSAVYKVTRVRMFNVEDCSHRDVYNLSEIIGGIDICFRRVHCEAYRNLCLNVNGAVHRIDRLTIDDLKISGTGVESDPTSLAPAVAIGGQVETVDARLLQIVKAHSGIRTYEAGGHVPRFLTLDNVQIEYCKNGLLNIEACFDLKIDKLYANTNHSGSALAFGAGARAVQLNNGRVTGARGSAVGFAGKGLTLSTFGFQDWNRGATAAPCVDLISGYDLARISKCGFGEIDGDTDAGAGAGTRAVRNNTGSGRSFIHDNLFSSDLHATPIENNGSFAPVVSNNFPI